MRFLLSLLAFALMTVSFGIPKSNAADPSSPAQRGSDAFYLALDGTWEGTVYSYYKDIKTGSPMDFDKESNVIRLTVLLTPDDVLSRNEKGDWVSIVRKGFFTQFKFKRDVMTLVGDLLHSGTDNDGQWVEYQTIYLTLKDQDTLLLYWLRAVNNTSLPLNEAASKWTLFQVGELHRVR